MEEFWEEIILTWISCDSTNNFKDDQFEKVCFEDLYSNDRQLPHKCVDCHSSVENKDDSDLAQNIIC